MRAFRDWNGAEWQVWKVTPSAPCYRERRHAARRREERPELVAEERRAGVDRRKGDIQKGWLCFDNDVVRRRLYPVPAEWERCSDSRLSLFLRLGDPVRRGSV